jgi:hypothetical protein
MDGLAPRTHRSDRQMASLALGGPADRQVPGVVGGRSSERSAQARAIPLAGTDDASLTLGRRLGVLVVLAALGGAILLAANGAGDRGGGVAAPTSAVTPAATNGPAATGVPLVPRPVSVPDIVTPETTLVTTRSMNLRVTVPDPGVPWDDLELRVLRGTREVAAMPVTPDDLDRKRRVVIRGVPLRRGTNDLTVVLANAGGPGPASEPLTIRVDDQPPRLRLEAPRSGAVINAPEAAVRGRTGARLTVVGRNAVVDARVKATADADGSFRIVLPLKRGRNTLTFSVRDAAGNVRPARVTVIRGNGKDEARLSLSPVAIRRSALPRTISATVVVLDANGRPIRGVPVAFTVAPPGLPAAVREMTTSSKGRATWSDIRIGRDAVVGEGLLTVNVTLPDGRVLTDTRVFEIRGRG